MISAFSGFSWRRLCAMVYKEFIQMKRDRPTLAMMLLMPIVQLVLFGFAINTNPKHLPMAVISQDNSQLSYYFVSALQNTQYFNIVAPHSTREEADKLMLRGDVEFILQIPSNFTRDLIRGSRPEILFEANGSDPATSGNAVAAMKQLSATVFDEYLNGSLTHLKQSPPSFELRTHLRYNPLMITRYNIVPGLLGLILTMTLVVITSLAMTRERERGTLENLLSTPVRPTEVILGKIIPFMIVAYVQIMIVLLAAIYIFSVPMQGSLLLLLLLSFPFVAANLSVGITFSTLATNQLQAVQSAMFFFLPSLLLSGFMFPFLGMPTWAQLLGNILPLTHYLRIVRGVFLKGATFMDVWPSLWPMLIFMVVMMFVGISRFRQTLD